jgi:hypothetical protein
VVELTSYGLTGLSVVLVMAFCFVHRNELPRTRERSSYDLINNPHLNESPLVETGAGSLRFREEVGKQQETAPASLLQKTSTPETGSGAINADNVQSDRGRVEILHG